MHSQPIQIVIPGDDPVQVQGSPHLKRLEAYGEVTLYTDRPTSQGEQLARVRDATCLVNSRSQVKWPGELLRQLPTLRMITVCGIGTDSIDLDAARAGGIAVYNIPARTAPIVAEHALALLLATARKAAFHTSRLKCGVWPGHDMIYLRGKMLGLIGAGSIARVMAQLGRAIGMRVQAWTFHPSPERAADLGVQFVALDELLQTSHAISVHVKLSAETRGMLAEREFSLMRPGTILVNTARGPIVEHRALVYALQSGRLAGVGADVFESEPVSPTDPLLQCEHVVLTPHNADQTPEGMDILNAGVVDNVIAFLEGRSDQRVV